MNSDDPVTNPFSAPRFNAAGRTTLTNEYGLKISRLPLSSVLRSNRNPLLWVLLPLYRLLGSPDQVSVGLRRPVSEDELTRTLLPNTVEAILAQQHEPFQASGLQRIAYYQGPSTGAVASVGEVYWQEDKIFALNLVVQSIRFPSSKSVQALQSLITPLQSGRYLVTYCGERSIAGPPQVLVECMPDQSFDKLYQHHCQRMTLLREEIEPIAKDRVMSGLVKYLQLEIDWFLEQGYLAALTTPEYLRLRMIEQLIDFKVVKPQVVLQYIPPFLFVLMLVVFVGLLVGLVSVAWCLTACLAYLSIGWVCRSLSHRRLRPNTSD